MWAKCFVFSGFSLICAHEIELDTIHTHSNFEWFDVTSQNFLYALTDRQLLHKQWTCKTQMRIHDLAHRLVAEHEDFGCMIQVHEPFYITTTLACCDQKEISKLYRVDSLQLIVSVNTFEILNSSQNLWLGYLERGDSLGFSKNIGSKIYLFDDRQILDSVTLNRKNEHIYAKNFHCINDSIVQISHLRDTCVLKVKDRHLKGFDRCLSFQ